MPELQEPKTYLSQPRQLADAAFIERNHLKLRTPDEIFDAYKAAVAKKSILDFETDVYLDFLPFEFAKQIYKPEYITLVENGERVYKFVSTTEEAAQDFLDYMNFAWGKAEDERGISASRSIDKLGAWLWSMGREDLHTLIHKQRLFAPYGAPALIAVCESMGIEVPASLREFADQ